MEGDAMAKPRADRHHEAASQPGPNVVKVGPKGVITIPEDNRAAMGIQPGQYLTTMQVGNMLILSPEINRFLDVTAEFQRKMADSGLTAEIVLEGQETTRNALYERLYGGGET
jgi:bifunctional DNA-binding transcriptional regulator/antitoxin component of YhaV-PrlF toxin-antitoxin module